MHRTVFCAAVAAVSLLHWPALAQDKAASALLTRALMGQVLHNTDADEKITRAVIDCTSLQLTSEDADSWVNFYAIPVKQVLVSSNPYTGVSVDCELAACIKVAFRSSRTGAFGRQNYGTVAITFAAPPAQSDFVAGFNRFVGACPPL
jgi:hypothetical protein